MVEGLAHPRLPNHPHLWQKYHCSSGNNARMAENRCPFVIGGPFTKLVARNQFCNLHFVKGVCDEF